MNILYYKLKLAGAPFRCAGGGDGGGGGDSSGVGVGEVGAADPGAGGAPAGPGDAVADLGTISITAPAINTSLSEIAEALGISPTEAAMMSQSNATGSNVATNGMTQAELSLLSSVGLGDMDVSETQTVDQALAAMTAHSAMNTSLPALMSIVNPQLGMMVAQTQALQGLVSGQVSVGQSIANAAVNAVAQSMGLPVGVVAGIANGNPGQAVSAATTGAVVSAIAQAVAQATGIPANAISSGLSIAGVPSSIGSATVGAVNSAVGASPAGGSNVAALGNAIDAAIGAAPSSGSAPTSVAGVDSGAVGGGDAFGFPSTEESPALGATNYAGLTGQAGQEPDLDRLVSIIQAGAGGPSGGLVGTPYAQSKSGQENAADIELMQDIFGTNLSAPPAGDINTQTRELARLMRS